MEFLTDGYDTIGENWGGGTHAHGWSCTPARDMLIYTLGVTPAEPGFARARIAPRLGRLEWAKGEVPTPRGPISVEMSAAGRAESILRSVSRCILEASPSGSSPPGVTP